MRKNILIAALLGLSVAGLVACSGGEESKPADDTTPPAVTDTSAMNSVDAVAPAADASAMNSAPAAAEVQQAPVQTADAESNGTPDATTTTTTSPDSSATTTTTTAPAGDPTADGATTTTTTPPDSSTTTTTNTN